MIIYLIAALRLCEVQFTLSSVQSINQSINFLIMLRKIYVLHSSVYKLIKYKYESKKLTMECEHNKQNKPTAH